MDTAGGNAFVGNDGRLVPSSMARIFERVLPRAASSSSSSHSSSPSSGSVTFGARTRRLLPVELAIDARGVRSALLEPGTRVSGLTMSVLSEPCGDG